MALQSIEPKYKDWVNNITPDNIYSNLLELQNDFDNILDDILHSTLSDKLITERGNDIRKELFEGDNIRTKEFDRKNPDRRYKEVIERDGALQQPPHQEPKNVILEVNEEDDDE